ncbi:HNH endonuclease [Glycomyces amatae]|uniref:HNH endonuclease n=1 Tax=Glycomyces amatae TaxID=2881355 RepID=UPI0034E2FB14
MAEHDRAIPEGHHIHHSDGDPLNNNPSNLECITAAAHQLHHSDDRAGECAPERLAHLERIRPLASAWHQSEAGRAWHTRHGARTWANRQPHERRCDQCGAHYDTLSKHGSERFCTNACKSAWRRASGIDDVTRSCEHCGAAFRTNKYSRSRFCGRSCAASNRHAREAGRLEPHGR